jgi:hypothetical protein
MTLAERDERRSARREARRASPWSKLVSGAVVLAVGVIFWLDQTGRIDAWDVLEWWSVALIASGLATLAERRYVGAVVLLFLGLAFLPSNAFLPSLHVGHLLAIWPLLITAAGATLIVQALKPATKDVTREKAFRAIALMAGNNRRIATPGFAGGEAVAVMGGCEIDLSEATLAPEAVIDVLAFWGGIELKVPRGWQIENRVLPLLGALTDNTAGAPDGAPRLVLRGSVIMGAIEVKNPKEPLS